MATVPAQPQAEAPPAILADDRSVVAGLAQLATSAALTVGRDGFNPHFQYAYMTEEALFAAARAALAEAGLSGTISFEQGEHEIITTFKEVDRQWVERPAIMATVQAKLTIRDKVGMAVDCYAYGQGIDPADKAYAKAMTMAAKYVVQKALMIAVAGGDDTDAGEGHAVGRANGGGSATASDKQLGFLCAMVKNVIGTEHGETEPYAWRLARQAGDPADVFAKISKRVASDLIERLKKVEGNPQAGAVINERLCAWEVENGHSASEAAANTDLSQPMTAGALDTAAAGQPDEPVPATTTDEIPFGEGE
jgi:hypothetical protein